MKKVLAMLLVLVLTLGCLTACGDKKEEDKKADDKATTATDTKTDDTKADDKQADVAPAAEQGKVFNCYGWNEEFKGFFQKYYTAEIPYKQDDAGNDVFYENAPGKKYIDAGVKFNWIINPSDGGVYQEKLDAALKGQEAAAADDKVDMFLAEADYIMKYADSALTQDITKIGVTEFDKQYAYTLDAASAADGTRKGVSFQCAPSALIYRRSIAKDVLGSDDPATVQAALDSWDKFEAVAADAKAKGYYMTASFAEPYRAFSNNCTMPWVDADKKLQFDPNITKWVEQTKMFSDNGYTIPTAGIWDGEKNDQMYAEGKTMCFFGPAWYFNFCMGNAQDPDKGCYGDWAITQGPEAHFWGGTWIMAPTGTDNTEILADIMKAFTVNEEIMSLLVSVEGQYPNNTTVVDKFANDATYGNAFLGGLNDIAIFKSMTGNIKWQYHTNYDQLLNEGFQDSMKGYFVGDISYEQAMDNFYAYVAEKYPAIVLP